MKYSLQSCRTQTFLTLTRLTIWVDTGVMSSGTALVLNQQVNFLILPHERSFSFRFSPENRPVIRLSFVIASDPGTYCRFPRSVVITTSHLHLIMSFCFPKPQVIWIIYRAWNFNCILDTSWGLRLKSIFPGPNFSKSKRKELRKDMHHSSSRLKNRFQRLVNRGLVTPLQDKNKLTPTEQFDIFHLAFEK